MPVWKQIRSTAVQEWKDYFTHLKQYCSTMCDRVENFLPRRPCITHSIAQSYRCEFISVTSGLTRVHGSLLQRFCIEQWLTGTSVWVCSLSSFADAYPFTNCTSGSQVAAVIRGHRPDSGKQCCTTTLLLICCCHLMFLQHGDLRSDMTSFGSGRQADICEPWQRRAD